MNKEEKNMKDFLSAVKMGNEIFSLYENAAVHAELKTLIHDSKELFLEHEKKLQNLLGQSGYNISSNLKLTQKFAIMMEKFKIKNKNDFYLSLEIISSMKTAMVKGLVFLKNNNKKINEDYVNAAKEVIRDYDDVLLKYKDFAINII